jgi:FkbM family methyltransferase
MRLALAMKKTLKFALLGEPGIRERKIRLGLLRDLNFHVDTTSKAMRLVGLDEREIASHLRFLAGNAKCAIDIGASDGWYSLFCASLPAIDSVYAFEPSAELNAAFEDNFRVNAAAFRKKTTLINKFVGCEEDGVRQTHGIDLARPNPNLTKTLFSDGDTFCTVDRELPHLPRPVLFKIDVDGGEFDVLKGAKQTLCTGHASLVVETHTPELESWCIEFVEKIGYRTTIVKNGWYRTVVPETRPIAHNRWFIATNM